jgi:N-acetyl-anhydromuramyl-L-alanine amidase AmpD
VIDTIVVHYTATEGLPRLSSSARGLVLCDRARKAKNLDRLSIDFLAKRYMGGKAMSDAAALCLINSANNKRTASWHYCIASLEDEVGKGVEVVEYVDPNVQAHHVGALGLPTNLRSVGIECCYPGPAPRPECPTQSLAASWYDQRGWGREVLRSKRPDGLWRYWALQPEAQLEALRFICLSLCCAYPTINAICSHHLFAPKKRIDPDPPISLEELRHWLSVRLAREFFDRPQGHTRS